MNNDQIKGAVKDAAGAVKKTVGHVVGNERMEAQGLGEQAAGKAQKAMGDVKESVRDALK